MKTIIGAAIGNCVHVGGLHHFLKLAEAEGYQTKSMGPAVSVKRIIEAVRTEKPDILALSYRLTPDVAGNLIQEIIRSINELGKIKTRFIFGGPPPVANLAKISGFFEKVFDGSEPPETIKSYLRGASNISEKAIFADDLIGRINKKYPYPILRHHFGRPSLSETFEGIKQIALAEVLDVISIGTDQNAQENFFRPDEIVTTQQGAGGVPVRTYDDMKALYQSSRCGNYPLMRCYAGTRDLLKWAEMSVETIRNAWAAIPLCWYSVIDGRSNRSLVEAITENQNVMRWYASENIPVEVNESHQWSLRDAHDALAVTMAYLAAYNAKKAGVRNYVSQFMFNTPPETWPNMDIAKMMAKLEMIQQLEDETFTVYREVRAGIAHFSSDPSIAKGQLAASALISLAMKPHILHVVGFSEGDHATGYEELIESCKIVHGVIQNGLKGLPDFMADPIILARKEQLQKEAGHILGALTTLGSGVPDPYSDPVTIAKAIETGILDAPHFRGNPFLKGDILTRNINGAWHAIDPSTGDPLDEKLRLEKIITELKK
jgi:hypothetical protein